MKVLIAAGGGGHFSAALAVIKQMPKDWKIQLVGRKYTFEGDDALSLEYQTANRLGLPFETITTGRLQRKFTTHSLVSLSKMPLGFTQARGIIKRFQPDVVLTFGGYVSVPVVLSAAFLRIPIVVHEQILHAGLANKIAARFAAKVCISWEQSAPYFPKEKTTLTGNPLRKEFLEQGKRNKSDNESKIPVIYITGGSGGAHGINVLIEECLEELVEKYTVIHQTGDAKEYGDYKRLMSLRDQLKGEKWERYVVKKFIEPEKVFAILDDADLVITRSGINTVTELLYLGKPSLLIPLPYGQHNEQLTNAQFVKKIGLGEVVDQLTSTPESLLQKIDEVISHLAKYRANKEKALSFIHSDAAEKIIKEVVYAKEKRITT
jgi:UDP-N-acetylglucosamine--N-acetylmuramyl-(pentapeptide) pyrophosphoryl-undecaprenol N-acetylglucosamine transferase